MGLRVVLTEEEAALRLAAEVHSVSWRESHRVFCSPDFVAAHTPERQYRYLREKQENGSLVLLLLADGVPVGVISVTGNLIADLYILPELQNKGYGTHLLRCAISRCDGSPALWILENNTGAERLYRREGFLPTGRRLEHPGGSDEIEFRLEAETQHRDRPGG